MPGMRALARMLTQHLGYAAAVCRARRAKARIAMTEMRKQANRVSFGVAEEETFYGEETEGLGRLTGREQFSGSVRTATVDTRNKRTRDEETRARGAGRAWDGPWELERMDQDPL